RPVSSCCHPVKQSQIATFIVLFSFPVRLPPSLDRTLGSCRGFTTCIGQHMSHPPICRFLRFGTSAFQNVTNLRCHRRGRGRIYEPERTDLLEALKLDLRQRNRLADFWPQLHCIPQGFEPPESSIPDQGETFGSQYI